MNEALIILVKPYVNLPFEVVRHDEWGNGQTIAFGVTLDEALKAAASTLGRPITVRLQVAQ